MGLKPNLLFSLDKIAHSYKTTNFSHIFLMFRERSIIKLRAVINVL